MLAEGAQVVEEEDEGEMLLTISSNSAHSVCLMCAAVNPSTWRNSHHLSADVFQRHARLSNLAARQAM